MTGNPTARTAARVGRDDSPGHPRAVALEAGSAAPRDPGSNASREADGNAPRETGGNASPEAGPHGPHEPRWGGWLRCGRFRLALDRTLVMGVVNVTPDSFSDGGLHATAQAAVAHALRLADEGADLLDIGGESTRPGAAPVPPAVEAARVLPVVRALRDAGVPISVDTRRPTLMRAALDEGADMINDIEGFGSAGAVDAVRASQCALVAMHMQGEPATMQDAPAYADVAAEVCAFLAGRRDALQAAGIAADRIVLDPGFGFGKTFEHNLELMRALPRLAALGAPLLVGVSRKGLVGRLTGRAPADRAAGSVAAALAAVARGARIVRVHDVAATCDALAVWSAF